MEKNPIYTFSPNKRKDPNYIFFFSPSKSKKSLFGTLEYLINVRNMHVIQNSSWKSDDGYLKI